MIQWLYSEDTKNTEDTKHPYKQEVLQLKIYVLYKSSISTKLKYRNYTFFNFSLNWILITSFCAQDKNLENWIIRIKLNYWEDQPNLQGLTHLLIDSEGCSEFRI